MGIFNRIRQKSRSEFINSIEWTDKIPNTIIWRFPCDHSKIKIGAQLTVQENQIAVLVNNGQLADVYQPGSYKLTTSSMPILTMLKGWKYNFNSNFKADIYFVNTKEFMNLHWGITNPIMMRDSEFGAFNIWAFGYYSFRLELDPTRFIRNVVSANGDFSTNSITEQLRYFLDAKFTNYLTKSKIAALDLATNLTEFSSELTLALKHDFSEIGIELIEVLIENISLPKALEEALFDKLNTTLTH